MVLQQAWKNTKFQIKVNNAIDNATNFIDLPDLLVSHYNIKLIVMSDGKLYFMSTVRQGEVVGIIEYTDAEKEILKMQTRMPIIDYLVNEQTETEAV